MITKEILKYHTIKDIMRHYKVSRAQAYVYKRQGYAVIRSYPDHMPDVDYRQIAQRTARYLGRKRFALHDPDLMREMEQGALIKLWTEADQIGNDERKAYKAALNGAKDIIKQWRNPLVPHSRILGIDAFLGEYENEGIDYSSPDETWMDPAQDSP